MPDELSNSIETAAKGPKRVRTDAGEVEQHSLREQIEADKYLAAKAAASTRGRGLRFSKLTPTPD
jgi:hypothetical protein